MSEQLSEDQIAPCPFCGGVASITIGDVDPHVKAAFRHIGCTDCEFEIPGAYDDAETIAIWNRRTPSHEAPDGFVLVPVEPTEDMWAAFDHYNGDKYMGREKWLSAWSDMLSARPTGSGSSQDHAPTADADAETRPHLEWIKNTFNDFAAYQEFLLLNGRKIGVIEEHGNSDWHAYLMDWTKLIVSPCVSRDAARLAVETAAREWLSSPSPDTVNPTSDEPKPVGVTTAVPGSNGGFTLAVFESSKVPLGVALYTSPPTNKELIEALQFYADPLRYHGPNQARIPGDKFQPEDGYYRQDVTRDNGDIARKALKAGGGL